MNRFLAGLVFLLVVCLLVPANAWAQSDSASISGFVRDPSGSVIPNASIVIKNESSGAERRATSNETGYYVVTTLPPGYYTLTVEATGFKKFEKSRNKLDSNISTTVNADMQVGAVTEVVEVTASAVALQSETATLGKLVTEEQIKMMQLNGRNPLFLALLKPGVAGGSIAGFSFAMTTGGLNINGGRSQDNLITHDGAVAVRTRSNGTSIGAVDLDSVQEVQIMTTDYGAEYGRSAGGQIRIVTKTGTQSFHGNFYEYFRNSALNANTWARNRTIGRPEISSTAEPFRYNQYGYNINGPIYIPGKWNTDKNKAFFNFGQEWAKLHRADTSIITVPTALMKTGNFSELLSPTNSFFGRTTLVNDPTNGQPFANNIIPANRTSPNGLALLRAYPDPVPGFIQGTNNFIQQRGTFQDQRKDSIGVDFNPSERHQFRFRHLNYNLVDAGAFRGGTDRAPATLTRPNRTVSLNWVWTPSPTVVHELLLTASVDRVYIAVQTAGDRYKRSIYGINYPYIYPDKKEIFDKIPTVNLQNFATLDGGPYPASSTGPIYNLYDNITKITGNHTLKFGFAFERSGQNDFDQINVASVPGGTNNQNGQFRFDNTRAGAPTSGLAIGNLALGLYSAYAELGVRSFTPYRGHMYEWFAQDSWKVTPKLRVELGLRHSIIQPHYSLWRNMLVFDPAAYDPSKAVVQDPRTGSVLSGDQYNGMVIPGDGWPNSAKGRVPIADTGEFNRLFKGGKSFADIHYKDFQPRLGIAYSVTPKMVLRSGFGKFVTRLGVSDSVFLGGNPPLQPTVVTANGSADNPGGAGRASSPFSVTTLDRVFPNPSAYAWNVVVEREMPLKTILEVGYVGRRGLHQQREKDINQMPAGTIQANPGVNTDFLRPFKGFGVIRSTNNEGSSWYNGLQVGATRRFSGGFSYGVAYTYSKTSDDGSAQRDIIPNTYDARNLYGPSGYDRRHILILNWIYELPLLRGDQTLKGKVLGGWQISGVTQFQTGTPFSVSTGDDFAGVGVGGGGQFWRKNGDTFIARGERQFSYGGAADQAFYFRTRNADGAPIFTTPAAGTFVSDNLRNIIYNPGFQNWTLGLFKNFLVTESQRVQFRWELYNWPNHPNWGGATGDPRSGTFGKVTSKSFERTMQLSLRYSF